MKKVKHYVLLFLSFALAGCATSGELSLVSDDVDAVKTRLFSMEKDLGGVRDESKVGLGSVEKTFKSDVAAVRKIAADIQATIDNTKGEAQLLNGRVDDMFVVVKKSSDELARYREDADKRIISLEDKVVRLQSTLDVLQKNVAETARPKETAPAPDALYMKGLETFKNGDMHAARELFQKFLEQNPQHELAANAHYWIGETYYSEKDYETAIIAFQDLIKKYPTNEKAAAAMLKQAMSFKAIKDTKNAKYVLKKLVESFPKSDEAKKAKDLLKEIR